MYGLRPMDDEEYEDYKLMAISQRRREEEDKERLNRETIVFSIMNVLFFTSRAIAASSLKRGS